MSEVQTLVYKIHPIPDFLTDNTLPSYSDAARLGDHLTAHFLQWIQFISCLWTWKDKATFALRYISDSGKIHVFFCISFVDEELRDSIKTNIEALLRTYRLLGHNHVLGENEHNEFLALSEFQHMQSVTVSQFHTRDLWTPKRRLAMQPDLIDKNVELDKDEMKQPSVVIPWKGPAGSYIFPMELMVSYQVKTAMTIYLAPTEISNFERNWLSMLSVESLTEAEGGDGKVFQQKVGRRVDPSAGYFGDMCMLHLKRISICPFLCLVQCCADEANKDIAQGIISSISSIVYQKPANELVLDDIKYTSGVKVYHGEDSRKISENLYRAMNLFKGFGSGSLSRLPLLTDSTGAATVFRLPVSMNAGVPGSEVRQLPPDFKPGPRPSEVDKESIEVGAFEGGGNIHIPVDYLMRHVFVTGSTGSGKTFTILQIIHQLWMDHNIPFLIIESAKHEYRGLLNNLEFKETSPPLRVYTMGNESCCPLRINPFELMPGIRLESHIAQLKTCIEASVPAIGPSSSIIAEALQEIYQDFGWKFTDVGQKPSESNKPFPKFSDFIKKMENIIVEGRGYKGEVLENMRAALIGRFKPLEMGSKGAMLDTSISYPSISELFETPVIIEMNDLHSDDKALMSLLLLVMLREHCEANRGRSKRLSHVTVVEEAHNILSESSGETAVEGATADTKKKTVEEFSNLITEIRAYGEGLIIADQSPAKLSKDVMRNTNLLIAHNLRDAYDRESVAAAAVMDSIQRDYVGKLSPGQAAVFHAGLEKATFIKVNEYAASEQSRGYGYSDYLSDNDVKVQMTYFQPARKRIEACDVCSAQCRYFDKISGIVNSSLFKQRSEKLFGYFFNPGLREQADISIEGVLGQICKYTIKDLRQLDLEQDEDAAFCHFIHAWEWAVKKNPPPYVTLHREFTITSEHKEKYMIMYRHLISRTDITI